MRRFTGGWGYKVDYDKAIAADERELALFEGPVVKALSTLAAPALVDAHLGGYALPSNALEVLLYKELRAGACEILGLTGHDLAAIVVAEGLGALDCVTTAFANELEQLSEGFTGPGLYKQGKALCEQLEKIPVESEARRKEIVRKAKARLARHKRNKLKNTGVA